MYIFIAISFQLQKHLSYILGEYYFEITTTLRCTDKSSNEESQECSSQLKIVKKITEKKNLSAP